MSRTPDARFSKSPGAASRDSAVDRSLRQFIEEVESPIWLTDAELTVTWLNPAAVRFLERPRDECVGRKLAEWLPDARGRPTAEVLATWFGEQPVRSHKFEALVRNDDGRELDAQWLVHPLHETHGGEVAVTGFACCAQDLSERRRVEARLQESDSRARAAVDAMFDPLVTIDEFGTVLQVNSAVERLFGYTAIDLVGKNVKQLMPEPHRSLHDEYLANYRATGRTWIMNRARDFEVQRKDGSRILCSLTVARANLPGGLGPVFTGTFRDVSELRRTEFQLRENELRLRALFDNSFEYFGMLTPEGKVIEVNQTALEAAGLTRAEVVGQDFWATAWWKHSPELQARLSDAVVRAARGEFVRFEVTHPQRDGTHAEIDFTLKPVRDQSGVVVMLIPEGRNISAIRRAQRAETAMLRALATVGESAALLAHEIKSPITAVNIALRAVADQLGEDHKEVLEDLVSRMQRLEQMLRRTLSFARPLEIKRAPVDLRLFLEDCVLHLRSQIASSGSTVSVSAKAGGLVVDADATLLGEVVTNLVTNAIEAKGSAARVVLSAELELPSEVVLCVDDDGPGIPESIRNKIFKPFVTTKKQGNGFGLAICKKVVEEHGGTIAVATSPLGGARFEIHLPQSP